MGSAALGLTGLILPKTVRAAPKKGGRLRVAQGHGSTTDSLDPATYENGFMQANTYARNNCLTVIAGDGSLQGELAESWEPSDDAAEWTFKIRQGVEFHNGKTMTVDDIIASLNHHRGDDSSSGAKPIVEGIADIAADGPDRVKFTLTSGSADFPFILADYHLCVFPSSEGKIDWSGGVGTGGYVLESFEPGVRATFKRHANYWKADSAYFDEIEQLSVTDPAARTNALITGEVDVIDKVDLKTVRLLSRDPNVSIIETAGTQHYTFAMDTRAEPFNNVDVRLALKYGIKRQEMVDKILSGHGNVGNDHPIARSNRYHAGDLPQREYDPDKAKFHLQKAGLSSLEVSLSAADAAFGGSVDAAQLYAESAAASGISINVVREPNDGYWSNVWMKKPWSAVYWGGRPTEDWMFTTAYAAGVPWNDTFWEHERFNQILVEARAELDEERRAGMYAEMQQIVSDDGGAVIPMFANYVSARRNNVATPDQLAANWDLDGLRFSERWWFDS